MVHFWIALDNDTLFSSFYSLKEDKLESLFHTLHTTDLFLTYFEKYQFNENRTYDKRKSLATKYKEVVDDLKHSTSMNKHSLEILEARIENLKDTPTITERKIFENLLFGVFVVLTDRSKEKFVLTERIADITNKIIEKYYLSKCSFSRRTSINTFIDYTYCIETAKGITLFHS